MSDPGRLVVGAGPAGLVAAATLARAGQPVTVLERHRRVGQRFHGDFQGLENWSSPRDTMDRLAELGVAADFDYRPFHDVTFYDSRLRPARAHSDAPLFYLVHRGPSTGSLDRSLLRQAEAAGADVRLGVTARHAGPGTILAAGPRTADGIVAGYTFRAALPDQAHVIVSPELAPGGYAYLLIWAGRATLATCLFTDLTRWRRARDGTAAAFQRLVPGLALPDARPFGGYGGVLSPGRYTDPAGRLFVGEAAGLQDPEWGFGMGYAIASGALAATCLLDGSDYPSRARAQFDPVRQAGMVNRALFQAIPQPVIDLLLRYHATRPDLRARLTRHWAPRPVKTLLAPRLTRRLTEQFRNGDPACARPGCTCVACHCDPHRPRTDEVTGRGPNDRHRIFTGSAADPHPRPRGSMTTEI